MAVPTHAIQLRPLTRSVAVLAAALTALALAACGGTDVAPDATATVAQPDAAAATTTAAAASEAPTAESESVPAATATVTPAVETATALPQPTATAEELVAWARNLCDSSLYFDVAVEQTTDGVDARSLLLDERIARELRNNALLIAATALSAAELTDLRTLAGAERFQRSLKNLFRDYSVLLDIATDSVASAVTHDEVDAAYSELIPGIVSAIADLRSEATALRVQTQEALAATEPCGTLVGF